MTKNVIGSDPVRCGLRVLLATLIVSSVLTSSVAAQDSPRGSLVLDVAKSVVFDPTTYAPAVIGYASQRADWNTSQVLFQAGWFEQNARFTLSGMPNDKPISYAAGNQLIRNDALLVFQASLVNNIVAGTTERMLIARYPEHRKLLRTMSWIERIAFASYASYLASAEHFRQIHRNQQLAREHGYVSR